MTLCLKVGVVEVIMSSGREFQAGMTSMKKEYRKAAVGIHTVETVGGFVGEAGRRINVVGRSPTLDARVGLGTTAMIGFVPLQNICSPIILQHSNWQICGTRSLIVFITIR